MYKSVIPTVKIIFDRRKKATSVKEGTVDIEVYFNRKRRIISTGVKVLPKNWHPQYRVVGRADSGDLNLKIEATEMRIREHIRRLILEGKPFSWSSLDYILGQNNRGSFVEFVADRVSKRRDIRESTRKTHRKFLNALYEFAPDLDFSNLDKQCIYRYDEWLRSRKTYTQTTISSYHKHMKVYINEAIRMEYITHSPYDGIKIDRGKPKTRKYLTISEVQKIREVELPTENLRKVRDLFVFQCYTGLAYADLNKFDFGTLIERDGRYIMHDVRQKTGEEYYIVILPPAMEVLKKYDNKLPMMTNQQYNMRLKVVADHCALDKNLTSHMGRHTYASLCLNAGISIEVLARMLGHSDIKTTQIYAKMLNKTVEDAYATLVNKLGLK